MKKPSPRTWSGNSAVNNDYRIESLGIHFTVIDPAGEQVDTYSTKEAAEGDIECCKKDDKMYESAKQLVDTAIRPHMQMFEVDRETAPVEHKPMPRPTTWIVRRFPGMVP
jgi:hypothetical protein